MNRVNNFIFVVLISFVFNSCSSNDHIENQSNILNPIQLKDILIDTINLSYLFESYEFIPLSMGLSNEAVFGKISKMVVSNGQFIILDSDFTNNIYVYDFSGNFRYKLSLGKGEGEVINIEDFCVYNNLICILDNGDKSIKFYDLDNGDFVRQIKLGHFFRGIEYLNDDKLVLSNSAINAWEIFDNNACVLFDLENEIIIPFHTPIEYAPYQEFIGTSSPFTNLNGYVYFASSFSNSIYKIKDYASYSKITIDFGKNGLHNHYKEIKKFPDLNKYANNTNYLSGMVASSATWAIYLIRNNDGVLQHLFIDSENSKKTAFAHIENDLYSIPLLYFSGHSDKTDMYTVLDINMIGYYIQNGNSMDPKTLNELKAIDLSATNAVLVRLIT